MVEELLADAHIGLGQIEGIAYGEGPGSFTGLRIAAGVTQVDYADRSVKFPSVSDLLKAWQWGKTELGLPGAEPVRRGACFSKGLTTGYGPWNAAEHEEIPGVDVLFSRGVEPDPTRTDDVDWERAR